MILIAAMAAGYLIAGWPGVAWSVLFIYGVIILAVFI